METKFKFGDAVIVRTGFYRSNWGYVVGYQYNHIQNKALYDVCFRFNCLKNQDKHVCFYEDDLELCPEPVR